MSRSCFTAGSDGLLMPQIRAANKCVYCIAQDSRAEPNQIRTPWIAAPQVVRHLRLTAVRPPKATNASAAKIRKPA